MRRKNTIEIKQRARLWAIYELTSEGMELVRKEVFTAGKPKCAKNQVAAPIAKGHVVFTMAYDDFVKNASKSEFIEIKEENKNAE